MINFRRLKIHRKHRSRTYDIITVPEIRLEGKWFEKAGFKEGADVVVKVQQNKLTIIPAAPDED